MLSVHAVPSVWNSFPLFVCQSALRILGPSKMSFPLYTFFSGPGSDDLGLNPISTIYL